MTTRAKSIIVPVRVLLCAWVLAGAVASRGVAQVTLVSNLGQAVEDYRVVGGVSTNPITVGMRFMTGDSETLVTKFTLAFDAANGSPSDFRLDLYGSFIEGVGPSDWVATFTGPEPFTGGDYDFIGTATLSLHTSYFLIASAAVTSSFSGFSWRRTLNTEEDVGGLAGWTIGDTLIANNQSFTWSEHVTGSLSPLMFSVQGSAVPEPSTYAVFAGLAALGLALCRRRYRQRAGHNA